MCNDSSATLGYDAQLIRVLVLPVKASLRVDGSVLRDRELLRHLWFAHDHELDALPLTGVQGRVAGGHQLADQSSGEVLSHVELHHYRLIVAAAKHTHRSKMIVLYSTVGGGGGYCAFQTPSPLVLNLD